MKSKLIIGFSVLSLSVTAMKQRVLLVACLLVTSRLQAEVRVPAFTAYLEPNPSGAWVSPSSGISDWKDPALKVLWFGAINATGQLNVSLKLRLPAGAETKLRLTVAGQSHETSIKGVADNSMKTDFGTFDISRAGYQQFTLESLNPGGQPAGQLQTLVLGGPAIDGAHFNLLPRRNTASVHLAYPTAGFTNIDVFYCEVTATQTPLWTYFEACGWHRGYFGMQVNSPTERRIIFSVWDSGNEGVERGKVAAEDRVTLVAKGADVFTGDFGHEGTGGHSHLVYDWQTGEKQRFLVTAKPVDVTHTIYSGYWFHPGQKKWFLISSWKAPKDGEYLHGLYSFVEDFNGANGQLNRKAFYGNQWLRTADGRWHEQTTAKFTHDATGKNDRLDRCMGVDDGQFFLSTGGFESGSTKFGKKFTRPATGQAPSDLTLPPLPE